MVILLTAIVVGGSVYCGLVLIAAWRYLTVPAQPLTGQYQPVSILVPLAGSDSGLEVNLRSLFLQQYDAFEIIFAVRKADDPAVSTATKLMREFPQVPAKIIVTGPPDYDNAKVFSLEQMSREALFDLFLMVDSDVRSEPELLRWLAAEIAADDVGLVTCPYRAVAHFAWYDRLEMSWMNTQFLAGVLVARMLEGMTFAMGATNMIKRDVVERIGGFRVLGRFLADDFLIGRLVSQLGYRVTLSSKIVEHHLGSVDWQTNIERRLRWARSTRRSRPWGYVGEVFTNPLPFAIWLAVLDGRWFPLLIAITLLRAACNCCTATLILEKRLKLRDWAALPVQDIATFLVWIAGFFGTMVKWRGRRYILDRDGTFQFVA